MKKIDKNKCMLELLQNKEKARKKKKKFKKL